MNCVGGGPTEPVRGMLPPTCARDRHRAAPTHCVPVASPQCRGERGAAGVNLGLGTGLCFCWQISKHGKVKVQKVDEDRIFRGLEQT